MDIELHLPAEQVYLQQEEGVGIWSQAYDPFPEGRTVFLSLTKEGAEDLIAKLTKAIADLVSDY